LHDLSPSTNWRIEDVFFYENNFYGLEITNSDINYSERLSIEAAGTYHGELTDWLVY
jgi:hypothetical protein